MRSFRLALLALGCVAGASSADLVLGPYLLPAADSAAVNAKYGVQTYSNKSSTTALSVDATTQSLHLTAAFGSEGTEGHSANLGILHPLNKAWSSMNISTTDTIQFDVMYDVKPKGGMEILLSSKLYPQRCADSGLTYLVALKSASLPAAGTWATIKLPMSSFAPPAWWTSRLAGQGLTVAGTYGSYPTFSDVLNNLQAIQFAPKTTYKDPGTQLGTPCTFCVTPTMIAGINLYVRNIKLIGYEEVLPNPARIGCLEKPTTTVDSAIDDNANELGGWWFAYSDTSTSAAKANDSARGSSNATMGLEDGFATLTAGLHKNTGVVGFDWRPYAGWAAIGMNFQDSVSTAFAGMTGISFNITKVNIGPSVTGINFKVQLPGVDVAKTHYAYLPVGKLDGSSICIRPSDLRQPSWVAGAIPFKSDSVAQLAWEAKITDQSNATIANDTAIFKVSNIQIHADTGKVGVSKRAIRGVFGVRYVNGILSVLPKAGYDNISVVSPSGRTVARLQPGVRSTSIRLERGTWLVVARNDKGEILTNKFAVMR